MTENNRKTCSSENNSYYWLSYDGLKNIISVNPYDHLESEQTRIEEKRHFLIDNKEYLCDHGGLHPIVSRKVKYIPVNVYNQIKETFIKIGKIIVCWDYIKVNIFLISLIMRYQREISNLIYVQHKCVIIC